jgi:hypothetical protein
MEAISTVKALCAILSDDRPAWAVVDSGINPIIGPRPPASIARSRYGSGVAESDAAPPRRDVFALGSRRRSAFLPRFPGCASGSLPGSPGVDPVSRRGVSSGVHVLAISAIGTPITPAAEPHARSRVALRRDVFMADVLAPVAGAGAL